MKLFLPNNLSRSRAEFTPHNDPEIASMLEQHYGLSEPQISVFAGANVSARNFKIETRKAKFFLKSRELDAIEKTQHEALITFELGVMRQKVPRIIWPKGKEKELVTVFADRCWMLYRFQEGDYFTGKGEQLSSAAKAFGELSKQARLRISSTKKKLDVLPVGLPKLLERSTIPADQRAVILKNLTRVEQHRELLNDHWLPVHLDFHPLNLLMNDDSVACIVDLEHLKPYPVVIGLGFAGFKLIRQAMVDDEYRARESHAVQTWLRGWQESFPDAQFTVEELGLGARARILTLIHMILDASLNHNDDRSSYDLEKQIVSLYEADVIFGTDRL
ncbi:MAG TPA: phosphotransferase [Pyrinomonadaceae bacterium]|nr:phosphotransferase [Pyrinomonadaceae bacterium]